ncbi:MAG: prepilin peptidase, partial [Alphaproteobacteria bacterium]|nr:prepilin peptidase [Alphaproteobacteria bacterium]
MAEMYFFIVFKVLIGIVVGGVLGSFFGLVYDRVPNGESIIKPRSYCDHCKQQLEPRDLIPIASYYLNQGECRFCHTLITQRHVIVEV